MARTQKQDANAVDAGSAQTGEVVIRATILAISCVISYWAVVATIFVYRYSHAESVRAALSRMAATSISFVLCLVYLLIFPFHVWGMAALIGIGAIVVTTMGRPDDTITTGITIAVVMVVAALSPHGAWRQPVLRLVDTAVGVAVGVAAAWLGTHAMRRTKLIGRDNLPNKDARERA
jgi:uncharacterized membrane protein YccC